MKTKRVIVELTAAQHARLHKIADKLNRPAKHLLEGILTERPRLSEQEKRETLRALKARKTDESTEPEEQNTEQVFLEGKFRPIITA